MQVLIASETLDPDYAKRLTAIVLCAVSVEPTG
jgi:hypothetical protein